MASPRPSFLFGGWKRAPLLLQGSSFFSPVIFFSFPILSIFFAFVVGPKNALHFASASLQLNYTTNSFLSSIRQMRCFSVGKRDKNRPFCCKEKSCKNCGSSLWRISAHLMCLVWCKPFEPLSACVSLPKRAPNQAAGCPISPPGLCNFLSIPSFPFRSRCMLLQ